MKSAVLVLVPCLVLLAGCSGLSDGQREEIATLVAENKALVVEMESLYGRLKDGSATVAEVSAAVVRIKAKVESNLKRIEEIHESGASTAAIIGGIVGALFRSVPHALTRIPLPGGLGIAVQGFLSLLLGGSATKRKEEKETP